MSNDVIVHRVGGAEGENLRLGPLDSAAVPPGISVLLDGTPQEAGAVMRRAFGSKKWHAKSSVVATATAAGIRSVVFELIFMPTNRLPNHARIIHPLGVLGFTDENLTALASMFSLTTGC